MTNELEKSLIETLQKQLPALQAESIIQTIEENKKLEKLVKQLSNENEKLQATVKKQESEILELTKRNDHFEFLHENFKVEKQRFDEAEILLEKRTRNFELEIKEVMLKSQININENMFEMMKIAFKSPVYQTQSTVCGSNTTRDRYNNVVEAPFSQTIIQKDIDGDDHRHLIKPGEQITGDKIY